MPVMLIGQPERRDALAKMYIVALGRGDVVAWAVLAFCLATTYAAVALGL